MGNFKPPFDPQNSKQLTNFRMSAAGIIRDILSAVWQMSPTLITKEIQQRWWSDQKRPSNADPNRLLSNASRQLRRFPDEFELVYPSIPNDEPGSSTLLQEHVQDLLELMVTFCEPDKLQAAAQSSAARNAVDWRSVCAWNSLSRIRSLLDDIAQFEKSTTQVAAKPVNGLSTQPPNLVKYHGKEIRNVRPLIWKLLNYLLSKSNWTSDVGELYDAIWGDDQSHKDQWGPVNSLLQDTRDFFGDHSIPYTVSGKKGLRQVFLTDDIKTEKQAKPPRKQNAKKPRKST